MSRPPMSEPILPAATVILTRGGLAGPEVLMGQRGAGAVFMPSKFVFPGGRVDPEDHAAPRPGFQPRSAAVGGLGLETGRAAIGKDRLGPRQDGTGALSDKA